MSYPCIHIHIEFYYDRNKNYVDYSALEIQKKSDQHCDTRKTDRSFTRRGK